jgi:hypothetical protein
MPIGTQTLTDNFNRANENPLAGNWTVSTASGDDKLQLLTNAVTYAAIGSDSEAFWTSWASGDDQYSQAEITAGSTGGSGEGIGVCVRRSSTASTKTLYRLVIDHTGDYELSKLVAGVFTSLRTGTVSYVAGQKLGLSVLGTTLKIWYNNSQVGSNVIDSSIASGLPGIAYSSSDSGATLDNWDAGTTGVLTTFPGLFTPKYVFSSPVTFDHTQVPSTQTNFPVLIKLSDKRFSRVGHGGKVQNPNGYDIRPYSDAGLTTPITAYELEQYGPNGNLVMWVNIASLSSSSDTTIYLRYGDSSISTDGSSATAWDTNFISVYHFKDGTNLSVADSTGTHNGTNHGATATAGQIDGAGSFVSANTQYIDVGTFTGPSAATISAWVNAISFPNTYNSIMVRNNNTVYTAFYVKGTGKLALFTSNGPTYDGTGSNTLSAGTWYLLHMTYDSSSGLNGYVNAAVDGTIAAAGGLQVNAISMWIGRDPFNTVDLWNGILDEVRYSNIARSADWITTEYNNQKPGSTFVTLGAET